MLFNIAIFYKNIITFYLVCFEILISYIDIKLNVIIYVASSF